MRLRWTSSAERDLVRLYDFLAPLNPQAASSVVRQLIAAAEQLLQFPELGAAVDGFSPRNVRHLFVGDYELRYELAEPFIYVLRLWHTREDR